jgi:hypothetical protein
MKTTWSGRVQLAVKRVAATVAEAVSGAGGPPPTHICDGFHCDCERRAEVAARARESAGAWLSGRAGWLKRERE